MNLLDKEVEYKLRSEELSLPLAYNFASAQEATDQDRVITTFLGDSITMISFGHKLQYLEQRTIQLGPQEFQQMEGNILGDYGLDFDDGTFFRDPQHHPPTFPWQVHGFDYHSACTYSLAYLVGAFAVCGQQCTTRGSLC